MSFILKIIFALILTVILASIIFYKLNIIEKYDSGNNYNSYPNTDDLIYLINDIDNNNNYIKTSYIDPIILSDTTNKNNLMRSAYNFIKYGTSTIPTTTTTTTETFEGEGGGTPATGQGEGGGTPAAGQGEGGGTPAAGEEGGGTPAAGEGGGGTPAAGEEGGSAAEEEAETPAAPAVAPVIPERGIIKDLEILFNSYLVLFNLEKLDKDTFILINKQEIEENLSDILDDDMETGDDLSYDLNDELIDDPSIQSSDKIPIIPTQKITGCYKCLTYNNPNLNTPLANEVYITSKSIINTLL